MRLDEALSEMQTIRGQLVRMQVATCYRSATTAASGVVALIAAVLQPALVWTAANGQHPGDAVAFLRYWSAVAVISVLIIGSEMGWRYFRISESHQRRHTRKSLAEFLPCIGVGLVLGLLFTYQQPASAPLLPGFWSVLFGLGILSTIQRLPVGSIWIVVHYLVAGFLCLKFGVGQEGLAPWTMALTFGLGQLIAALVLHLSTSKVENQPAQHFN